LIRAAYGPDVVGLALDVQLAVSDVRVILKTEVSTAYFHRRRAGGNSCF
jgi:hypothetical protein